MMKRTITIMIAGFITYALHAQKINKSDRQEIDEYLNTQIKEGAPGLAVGIIKEGDIVYESYLGFSNLEHKVPVDEETRFNIASVAKEFTALATLKLSLEGKLSLEDDIRKYIPNIYPEVEDKILVRHLINHTSGIRDFYDLMSIQQDPWWRKEGFDNEDAIEILLKQKELSFTPGSQYLYSNSNYTLLTSIVTAASGISFHEYSKKMFEELEMTSTSFLKDYMYVIPNKSVPYADWGNGIWQQYPMMTNLYGDGFLFTTLRDQLIFEQKIQEANEDLLTISQKPIENAEIETYGYGLELENRLGYKAVHHSGSTGAYHAQVVRYPEEGLSIVVMSNNGTLWSGYIADKIGSILLPKIEVKDKTLKNVSYEAGLSKASILGSYESESGKIIRIVENEKTLYWQMDNNNPIELSKVKDDLFEWKLNSKIKLGFTEEGFTVHYPGSEPKFHTKLDDFIPTKNYLNELIGTYESDEIDVAFTVTMENGGLVATQKGLEQSILFEIIHEDDFLVSNYILNPKRDRTEKVTDLLLTFSRLKNVRFSKTKQHVSTKRKFTNDGGYIQVATSSENYGKGKGDILLTKNAANDNEEWFTSFGGKSYDKASSIELVSDGGYLIVGSTSSFGNGNYDVWIIKTDKEGKELWKNSYGQGGNEYGVSAMETENGFLIKANKQECPEVNQWDQCQMRDWYFEIDKAGNIIKRI